MLALVVDLNSTLKLTFIYRLCFYPKPDNWLRAGLLSAYLYEYFLPGYVVYIS